MIKIGIFGGAFDPPHNGHIALARECVKSLKLKRLLIIPSGEKSGAAKNIFTPFDKRFEMTKIAFGGIECAETLDIERDTRSHTYDTLRKLQKTYTNTEFYLIIGSDQLFELRNWYRYDSLLREIKVAAFPRHENEYADMLEEAARLGGVRVVNMPVTEVSSSEIRGGANKHLLSPEVAEYIKNEGLYK